MEQQFVARGMGAQAAARRNHGARVRSQHAFEGAAFEAAKRLLAVHREHLAERGPGFALDLAVEFHERNVKTLGELLAERGFAGAAQADLRPFRGRSTAIDEIRQLLADRDNLYARADAAIDTSDRPVRQSLAELRRILENA